jgi:RimJ/RimL family protein N-acetyltransferase
MITELAELREVRDSDLPHFFEHQADPEASYMAAFTAADPSDRDAFDRHWAWIRSDHSVTIRTIVVGGRVAGHVAAFERAGEPEVTYWLAKEYWGRGLATWALSTFLRSFGVRPLKGAAAADNHASIRVLEKCGFKHIGKERGFANARGEEIEEVILVLALNVDRAPAGNGVDDSRAEGVI